MTKRTWAAQFKKSLEISTDEKNYRLRDFFNWTEKPESDEDALFRVGVNVLSYEYANKALQHLERLIDAAESPIEQAMAFALSVAGHDLATNVRYKVGSFVFGDLQEMPDFLVIEPQAQLGEYRVDFLLGYHEWVPDVERKEKLKDGTEIDGVREVVANLIVECDGHDFHDRSKEQASRDRERDRELKKLGFDVFRYTGSDIWKSPFGCATEAIQSLTRSVCKK